MESGAKYSTNDDTDLIIDLPPCVKTVILKTKGVKKLVLHVYIYIKDDLISCGTVNMFLCSLLNCA